MESYRICPLLTDSSLSRTSSWTCLRLCFLYSLFWPCLLRAIGMFLAKVLPPVVTYLLNTLGNCPSLYFSGIQLHMELLSTLSSFHFQDISPSWFSSYISSTSCWAPFHLKCCFSSATMYILEHVHGWAHPFPLFLLPSMYWLWLFISNLDFSPGLQRRANICSWRPLHECATDNMFKTEFATFPSRFMDGIHINTNEWNHPLSYSWLFNFL